MDRHRSIITRRDCYGFYYYEKLNGEDLSPQEIIERESLVAVSGIGEIMQLKHLTLGNILYIITVIVIIIKIINLCIL
jgi:hypothetical protein